MKQAEEYQQLTTIIDGKLNRLRHRFAGHVLLRGILRFAVLLIGVFFHLMLLEGFRYFDSPVRIHILRFTVGFAAVFLLGICIVTYQIYKNRTNAYRNEQLALKIEKQYPAIGDSLLDALQLSRQYRQQSAGTSHSLILASLANVVRNIEKFSFDALIPRQERTRAFRSVLAVVIFSLLMSLLFPAYFGGAALRLLHPRQEYPIPKPFTMVATSSAEQVLVGDTIQIAFRCTGRFPEAARVRLDFGSYQQEAIVPVNENGAGHYLIQGIPGDLHWEAYVTKKSPFIPWQRISTGPQNIPVTARPEILQVSAYLRFPAYSRIADHNLASATAELELLPGTEIELRFTSNMPLSEAYLEFADSTRLACQLEDSAATVSFAVQATRQFRPRIINREGVSNLHPMQYSLLAIPDSYPVVRLLSPRSDFSLSEAMEIPIGFRISDDFGFSKAALVYRRLHPYRDEKAAEREISLPIDEPDLPLQEIYYNWDVTDMGLLPEDAIEFHLEIYDNDVVNGPKKAASRTLSARFPSLQELYSQMDNEQEDWYQSGEQILENLEDTKEVLEEISRELLKKDEINWEQKAQLEQDLNRLEESAERLSQMGKQLQEFVETAENYQLFDESTLQKYTQLQEAFEDIMTPEMRDAMQRMQEAIQEMDPEKMRQALRDFQVTREEFTRELDRMLELFRRIKLEQRVAELTRRFSDLAERQEQLNEELETTDEANLSEMDRLAQEERRIQRDTELTSQILAETEREMQEFPLLPQEELAEIRTDLEGDDLPEQMQAASRDLQAPRKEQAAQKMQNIEKSLSEYADRMQQFQQNMQQQGMQQISQDFHRIIDQTLHISQQQEELSDRIRNTPYQSERLMDVAVEQQANYQNLARLLEDLIALSQKTFGVDRKISRKFGLTSQEMQKSIVEMEQRRPNQAARSSDRATRALNEAALQMMNSLSDLQQSGSASGYQQYLEQLQKMAGMQEGINQDTEMLSLSPAGRQRAMMQRLAARQQQVRKSLEQLQSEMQGRSENSGDLGGIAKDMDDVIKDLQDNRLLRRTLQRQQRILSRLLDAQKSLRTQDYKKERVSRAAEEILRESPGQLPADLGERRSVLQEKLEKALQEGYLPQYEQLIREYFESLSQDESVSP